MIGGDPEEKLFHGEIICILYVKVELRVSARHVPNSPRNRSLISSNVIPVSMIQ